MCHGLWPFEGKWVYCLEEVEEVKLMHTLILSKSSKNANGVCVCVCVCAHTHTHRVLPTLPSVVT